METVLESRSSRVVISPDGPFTIIGERLNPTGRKAFQAQLQAGDLAQVEIDVTEQIAGGADVLDVNVGDPMADEVGLSALAAPVLGADGAAVSALSISGPTARLTAERIDELAPLLKDEAATLTRRLRGAA